MSETLILPDGIKLEDPVLIKPVEPVVPEIVVKAEEAIATAVVAGVPDALKADVEKIVKDVLKLAIKELFEELKKSPLAALDKDGDGVVTAAEVKEAAVAQVAKLGCGAPACVIS